MRRTAALSSFIYGLLAVLVPAAMQFVLFAFFARALGVEQYGLYLALVSWTPICFELLGWGAGEYLIKRTSQCNQSFPSARRHLKAALALSLPPALMICALLTLGTTSGTIGIWTILIVGLGELLGLRLMVNTEQAAMALGRLGSANWLRSLQILPRFAGVLLAYWLDPLPGVETLAIGGALGTLAGGLLLSFMFTRTLPNSGAMRLSVPALRQGTWFVGTQLVRASQHNIDRIVLAPLVDPALLGLYGAAQRFIQMGLLPLQALLRLTYPRFFRAGEHGVTASFRFALQILPLALAATAATSLLLLLVARWLPLLIGPEFELSVTYLLYLAPILPLFALNSVLADTLSGAGHLSLRLLLTATGAALQALLFLLFHDGLLIVLASYAGISLSCLLTGAAVLVLSRQEYRRTAAAAP
ncbi:lipopolysaccharide biosynthesis protein [Devosia submarina]|uniref:lipopolysaccharide biosynthesis protein n=1 Tax=Devosia submarina TaxID=1173082 RepID=UPI000D34E485|nr:oligosaccharide flippase family protein [Devosia submarina]